MKNTAQPVGHTPGPWRVVEPNNPDGAGVESEVSTIIYAGMDYEQSGVERLGDAYLIAAAPDLLAALEQLVTDASNGEWMNTERLAQARAAIAKARP